LSPTFLSERRMKTFVCERTEASWVTWPGRTAAGHRKPMTTCTRPWNRTADASQDSAFHTSQAVAATVMLSTPLSWGDVPMTDKVTHVRHSEACLTTLD
jgi:hypothetical protein